MSKAPAKQLILVWCFAPCSTNSRSLAQILADEYRHVQFWQINADRCKEFSQLFNISQLPAVLVWIDQELTYVEEYISKENIERIINHKQHKPPKPSTIQILSSTWHTIFLEIATAI